MPSPIWFSAGCATDRKFAKPCQDIGNHNFTFSFLADWSNYETLFVWQGIAASS